MPAIVAGVENEGLFFDEEKLKFSRQGMRTRVNNALTSNPDNITTPVPR